MTILHVFFLSLIQGATEFLPVSSSAHLVLYNKFVVGLKSSLGIDIAMHFGSLLAVIFILANPIKRNTHTAFKKYGITKSFFFISLGTIPLIIMALFLEYTRFLGLSRQIEIIAFANVLFALLLFFSDRRPSNRKLSDISSRDILFIGIWQSFAVFPGASRSGTCITGARFLNFNRKDAITISLVLSIPSITLSSAYATFKLINDPGEIDIALAFYAAIFSFIFSFLALKFFVDLGESYSFTPYVVYRLILGFILLIILFI